MTFTKATATAPTARTDPDPRIRRYAAFSFGQTGGNPAGVMIADALPADAEMQRLAARVGYSETVFAARQGDGLWRVRYFSPEAEVPFCGHATIALGAALAETEGSGRYPLQLNDAEISVEGLCDDGSLRAELLSPPTRSRPAAADLVAEALSLFSLSPADLAPRIPPAIAEAGATHLVLALLSRQRLADMAYDLAEGQKIMKRWDLGTICLVHATSNTDFVARNAFASHGVLEDPATGAAAAAFAGYLRDLNWPSDGKIRIDQGEDMGMPSRIAVEIPPQPGAGVKVSGQVRRLDVRAP